MRELDREILMIQVSIKASTFKKNTRMAYVQYIQYPLMHPSQVAKRNRLWGHFESWAILKL